MKRLSRSQGTAIAAIWIHRISMIIYDTENDWHQQKHTGQSTAYLWQFVSKTIQGVFFIFIVFIIICNKNLIQKSSQCSLSLW